MPATYEPIATTTLGSAAATISFTSIGSGYTDLRLVVVHKLFDSDGFLDLNFNSDTSSLYSETYIRADGSVVNSQRQTTQTKIRSGLYSFMSYLGLLTIDIMSYAGSTNKTLLYSNNIDKNGVGGYAVIEGVGLYRSTSAISSITLTGVNSNIAAGTTATLYGILKA